MPVYGLPRMPSWFYPELANYLSCIDWGGEPRPLKSEEWIVGANMAFRRSVFNKFGLFDTTLGRKGTRSLLSNEEVALMRAIGWAQIFYIPDMVADHIIPNERIRIDWFRKRVFWQAISDVLAGVDTIEFDAAFLTLRDIAGLSKTDQDVLMRIQYTPRTADEVRKQLNLV